MPTILTTPRLRRKSVKKPTRPRGRKSRPASRRERRLPWVPARRRYPRSKHVAVLGLVWGARMAKAGGGLQASSTELLPACWNYHHERVNNDLAYVLLHRLYYTRFTMTISAGQC